MAAPSRGLSGHAALPAYWPLVPACPPPALPAGECEIQVTVLDSTTSGSRKVKLMGVAVSEEATSPERWNLRVLND